MNDFINNLNLKKTDNVPIWLMRQAGRYLPEYRELRKQAGSFLDLCYNPELAAEVTIQPIKRFNFDAAILFSDILVIPHALGIDVQFIQGDGPKLELLSNNKEELASQLEILSQKIPDVTKFLNPVIQTVEKVRGRLDESENKFQISINKTNSISKASLIGFCGAPWTVALYMLDAKPSKNCDRAKIIAFSQPENFAKLMDILVESSVAYLDAQIKAGVDVVQTFDSWAGQVPHALFEVAVKTPLLNICRKLKKLHPDTPIILFPRGLDSQKLLELVENNWSGEDYWKAKKGVKLFNGLGLDYTVDLQWACDNLQDKICLQGNLDPTIMLSNPQNIRQEAEKILKIATQKSGYIFNFGHGILPNTPIENVEALVGAVRGFRNLKSEI